MAQRFDWAVAGRTDNPAPVEPENQHTYDLFNITTAEALKYGERPVGINLVWTDPDSSDNVRFAIKSGGSDALRYFQPIGINIRGGGWLVHKVRDYGINLGWSESPRFEWELRDDVAQDKAGAGGVVKTGVTLGLYNHVEKDFLMYERRDWGINLKWYGDAGKHSKWSKLGD
ncbi:MAG: hypothetical protein ACREX8_16880, partial [Gammaproteobacteria bacterium]